MSYINRHREGWLEELERAVIAAISEGNGLHAYALLDGAFQPACYRQLKASRQLRWHALFSSSPGANEETLAASPILLELEAGSCEAWKDVLRLTDGLPMLSWLATPESLGELVQRLLPWCVVDAAGQNLVLRFADTRRLPDLVSIVTPEQLGQFAGLAAAWHYIDRDAQWHALPLPETGSPPAENVFLDDQQCARLIAGSEADEMIAWLQRTNHGLTDGLSPANSYRRVASALACADKYGVENRLEREQMCRLFIEIPRLRDAPRFQQALSQLQDGKASFAEVIDSFRMVHA